MTNAILRGKPDAGNPHARFDEGEVASEKPRRGSLLYRAFAIFALLPLVTLGAGEVRLGGAIAATAVTRLADGTVSVNLLGESEATFPDGVKVRVVGGYPVREHVAVLVQSPKPVKVRVRVPDWCPWVDVRGYRGKVLMLWTKVHGGWFDFPAADSHDLVLDYRMPATIVQFPGVPVVPGVGTWAERFWSVDNPEVAPYFRTTAASRILKGPLILAKSKNAGTDPAGILSADTIDGRGFGATLEPLEPKGTWGRWRLTLTGRDGEKVTTDVCDFQSAADFDDPDNLFSIWF